MDKLFLTVLNMSLTGGFVIAALCLARLPLKKAPKIISYCLWAVAGFRLAFPFSVESVFSLIPFRAQPIPPDIAAQTVPRINSGISLLNNAVSGMLANPAASVNPLSVWTETGAYIWLLGAVVMLVYGAVSAVILKRDMRKSVRAEENIYEADNIKSPFVLGIIKPRIYLPAGLPERERGYVLLHEQTHIKRRDHIVKFAAYLILCPHWFNPLAWAAFLLMGADMEMSCDERVLKETGGGIKKDYSLSLLSLAAQRRVVGVSPLAFGEGGIRERVKNILNFKTPPRAIIIAAAALAAVLSAGLAVNRASGGITAAHVTLGPPGASNSGETDNQTRYNENGISVTAEPNPYTTLTSVSPGMRIEVSYNAPFTDARYLAENGTFLTWSGGPVTPLGNDATVSAGTPVYWTPFTPDGAIYDGGDTVTVSVILNNGVLAETVLPIKYEGENWYSVGEGVAPPDSSLPR